MATATADAGPKTRTVSVVALTTAFYNMKRYRRGTLVEIEVRDGQRLPRWCVAAKDVTRDRDGHIDLDSLPIYQPASVE